MSLLKFHKDPARREEQFRLLMVGVFSVMFIGVLLVYFVLAIFDVPLKPDNFTNSYSTSPAGHSALVELLRQNVREVRTTSGALRAPDDNGDETETLVLLEPRAAFVAKYNEEFVDMFSSARQEHSSVVIALPKRVYQKANKQAENGDIILWEDVVDEPTSQDVLASTGFDDWFDVDRIKGPVDISWYDSSASVTVEDPVQVFRPNATWADELEVLAETGDGDPVVVRWLTDKWRDRGGVILVSDPDFFTNRFISNPGAGEFCVKLFDETPRRGAIAIDEDMHGFSTDASVEYLAATPPGLWVTLSAMALLLIFGWRQATVLRPQEAEPQDRQARKYAIEGLARMMERTRDHHSAYRRILRRSRFVLGTGAAQVQGAGMTPGTHAVQKGKTGKITRIQGGTDEERLVAAAKKVAHQKRTGETEHGDFE